MAGSGSLGYDPAISDRFDLERFVAAQDRSAAYVTALAELARGVKSSHWMWFVFPQMAGLGRSATAQFFAIASLDEARAYLAHPVLGPRLRECAAVLLRIPRRPADEIFGTLDAAKLKSSMTLFLRAAPNESLFAQVLRKYFDDGTDAATDAALLGL